MRAWQRSLLAVSLSLPAAFAWSSADAESKKPTAAAAAPQKRFDANNQTAMSEAMVAIVEGAKKFESKDVDGAIVLFRKAVGLQPRNALAQYALGEALMSKKQLQEAEAALMAADDAAPQTSSVKARVVFVLASVKERLHKWDEAKELWRRYLELAQAKGTDAGVYPQSATERMKVVDDWAKMDAAYVGVRERIAATSGGGSAPVPPGSAAPAPAAKDGGK
jgi:tetratricopeptide (TPR) repeat protein